MAEEPPRRQHSCARQGRIGPGACDNLEEVASSLSRTTTMGWGCWERATEGKGCYAVLAPFICSSAVGGWADSKVWTGELATPDAEQAVWRRSWGRRLQAEQAAPSLRGCVR